MEPRSYKSIRNHLAQALDQVNDDQEPILITRQKGRPAVLMSLEEYRSWEETLHLARNPVNAKRLNRAIAQLEAGKGRRMKLLRARLSGQTKRGRITSGGRAITRKSTRASMR